jgi:fructose-1,6-bisphosphatase/inositol monophosphatase family enzyme
MSIQLAKHLKKMFELGQQVIQENPNLNQEIGSANTKGDQTIGMDVHLEETFINYLRESHISCKIYSEEEGVIDLDSNPEYFVAIDPLDGSSNYKFGKGILPFGSIITFYKGVGPKLSEVVVAGMILYPRNLGWIYEGGQTKNLEGERIKIQDEWPISKSTPVYLDIYKPEWYQHFSKIPGNLFVRNEGSTSGNLSLLLSNAAAGIGALSMVPEEIGAVYALVKGAGGVVVNHNGEDIGNEEFSPEKKYQVLAGSANVVDRLVELLHA